MKLNNHELYKFFASKNIKKFYHANTVTTALSFISSGGLLSRGGVEGMGLVQTPQSSDDIDKIHGVWNDIFLDTEDLHTRFNRQNFYGPVLFVISTDFLLNENNLDIWITKDNPIYWVDNMPLEDKYFLNVQELSDNWEGFLAKENKHRMMVTIKNVQIPVLFNYLLEVIIDDPACRIGDISLAVEAKSSLMNSPRYNEFLAGKMYWRHCEFCFCRKNYLEQLDTDKLAMLFLPNNHLYFQ